MQRWACLLKQQTLITVYRLPTKVSKLTFSVCRHQTEVCRFRFPFAANKWKLPFSVSSFCCMYVYLYIEMAAYVYRYMYIDTYL
jgi:hypothetical protein